MSRADDLRDTHQAELAVVEFEDELLRLKNLKRPDQAKLRETKLALREARQRFRELRGQNPAGWSEETAARATGDAVASPATIEATAAPERLGGDA